jgi:hypothetical protein
LSFFLSFFFSVKKEGKNKFSFILPSSLSLLILHI